jgi:glycosyltransferase involved in cell wall biosynthesis
VKENNLFFSVVIPLYNAEQFIQRAIKSVLDQTVQDFEVIVIDDGSIDSSYQKVLDMEDSRIKVIRQENQGVSVARNKGIEQASSSLVAFLDADDEWKPNFLEKMCVLISQFPDCVLFGSGYATFRTNGLIWHTKEYFPVDWSGIIPNYIRIMRFYPFFTSSVVIRKTVLTDIGGFPVGVKFGQDVATWLRCSLVGKIAYINQPLVIYHTDGLSSTSQKFDRRQEPYPVILLNQLLHDHAIPVESIPYAVDYIAKSSVKTSKARFRAGEPIRALFPLWNCLRSRTYWKRISPLLLREFFPSIKKALLR